MSLFDDDRTNDTGQEVEAYLKQRQKEGAYNIENNGQYKTYNSNSNLYYQQVSGENKQAGGAYSQPTENQSVYNGNQYQTERELKKLQKEAFLKKAHKRIYITMAIAFLSIFVVSFVHAMLAVVAFGIIFTLAGVLCALNGKIRESCYLTLLCLGVGVTLVVGGLLNMVGIVNIFTEAIIPYIFGYPIFVGVATIIIPLICTAVQKTKYTQKVVAKVVEHEEGQTLSSERPRYYSVVYEYSYMGKKYTCELDAMRYNRRLPKIGSTRALYIKPDDPEVAIPFGIASGDVVVGITLIIIGIGLTAISMGCFNGLVIYRTYK